MPAALSADHPLTAAEGKMAVDNYGLVHWCARRLQQTYPLEDFDDLMSRGMFGLFESVRRFDPSLGFKFSTYAVTAITHAMTKEIKGRQTQGRGMGEVPISLDSPYGNGSDGEDGAFIDYIEVDSDPADEVIESSFVLWAEGAIPAQLRGVLPVMLGERTHSDVAVELGVSRSRVGQMCKLAAAVLRRELRRANSE